MPRSDREDDNGCACRRTKDTECGMTPLCLAETGKQMKVACVEAGRGLCARMASMGIYPGAKIEMLCGGCPCLVRVSGGTISLGAGVSEKILVTPE
jgi:ferrous iron transport protein A